MKGIKDLVGYRMIALDDKGFTVKNPTTEEEFHFFFREDEGNGGSNETKTIFVDPTSAPVITEVEIDIEYSEFCYTECQVRFLWHNWSFAEIKTTSSTERADGRLTDANVTVLCKEIPSFEERLSSY